MNKIWIEQHNVIAKSHDIIFLDFKPKKKVFKQRHSHREERERDSFFAWFCLLLTGPLSLSLNRRPTLHFHQIKCKSQKLNAKKQNITRACYFASFESFHSDFKIPFDSIELKCLVSDAFQEPIRAYHSWILLPSYHNCNQISSQFLCGAVHILCVSVFTS